MSLEFQNEFENQLIGSYKKPNMVGFDGDRVKPGNQLGTIEILTTLSLQVHEHGTSVHSSAALPGSCSDVLQFPV